MTSASYDNRTGICFTHTGWLMIMMPMSLRFVNLSNTSSNSATLVSTRANDRGYENSAIPFVVMK